MRRGSTASSTPSLDPAVIDRRLAELLRPEPLDNPGLRSRLERLRSRHLTYCRSVSPIWAPGAIITTEMRIQAEAHLPLREFTSLLHSALRLLCRFSPAQLPVASPAPLSWPDLMSRLPFHLQVADPSLLCCILMAEPADRLPLIFALFIPRHHGGGFGRYPSQMAFLDHWLKEFRKSRQGIRCLDAACGSGEGTWELALALERAEFSPSEVTLHGSSLDRVELFAAIHLFFPNAPHRQHEVRQRLTPLLDAGFADAMEFFPDDLLHPAAVNAPYDLILCNGAVGGPFIHDPDLLKRALSGLVQRLAPNGLLLLQNKFHGGWKKAVGNELLTSILAGMGVEAEILGEGLLARR